MKEKTVCRIHGERSNDNKHKKNNAITNLLMDVIKIDTLTEEETKFVDYLEINQI